MLNTLLLVLLTSLPQQQLLSDILKGQYKPVTLSSAQMDSVLNGASAERLQLRYENKRNLFRRSWEADWYLLDTQKDKKLSIGHGRDAVMSPNGKYVVYSKDNALWIYKVDFGTQVVMTHEDNDSILCGISDWLYEEEFSTTCLFAFSPDSRQVAFIRLDPRQTVSYAWQEYLRAGELSRITSSSTIAGPVTVNQFYPSSGTPNPRASLCVYDIQNKGVTTIPLTSDPDEDFYLPRLAWRTLPPANPKAKDAQPSYEIVVQKINRDQTGMELVACNPRSTVTRVLYRESSDDYYMDYELFDSYRFLQNGQMLLLSEREGFRRLYLHEADGTPVRCLTPQDMDLTDVYGLDATEQTVYFEAAPTPMTRQAYALAIKKGGLTQLTQQDGMHHLRLSADCTQAIDCFQSVSTPHVYTLYALSPKGMKAVKTLEDNQALLSRWKEEKHPDKHFFTFSTERGDLLNGWMLRPAQLEKNKKYPVVVLQYSGPQSQRVLNRWSVRFETYLVEAGYIVVCIDPRGTDCRGRQFRNETYMYLGRKEAEDLQSLANTYLPSLPYVDPSRIVLGGWSYGGYQTIRTMMEANSAYRCGFAVAPVTDWRLYDTGYTERYMRRPQVNERGYQVASLLNKAKDLQGNLLLISGMADDNVHPANTWLFVEALVQAGKQFDMQLYPDDNHFLRQRDNYLHLHERIIRFLNEHL